MNMDMKGQGGGRKIGEAAKKPQSLQKSVARLFGYMNKSKLLIIITIVTAAASTVMQVITPKIMGNATTEIFNGLQAETGIRFDILFNILFAAGALYLGIFILGFLQERIMTIVSLRTTQTLRNEVKEKLNKVPLSYFDKHSNGDLMSLAINDIDNIATNLQQSMTQLISSAILIVGTFTIMIFISPLLTALVCVMIPGSALIAKIFTPKAQKNNKIYVQNMAGMNGTIEESYQNFQVIKSFQGEEKVLQAFRENNESMCESGWRAKFFGSSMMHLMMLIQNCIYVLIAAIGGMKVLGGSIIIGDLQAFLQYSQQFTSPISKLSQTWSSLLAAVASAERVFALLDAEEMDEYMLLFDNEMEQTAKVSFENVQFGYEETPLMKDFTLDVEEGQMVAIVGHTGAGKTTLVNLLERFYEIQDGSIRIDGRDIRNLDYHELRKSIGMVLQDTWLFSGTIFDNIKFGNEDATDEQIYAAAKAAYADDFIRKLPDGYQTILNEEAGNISQGQKQLITIARAFAANPEILILDEATSNVDSRTEMIIQKAMKRLLKGRTSFVVAHRLSTIYDADRIVVMDQGDIVESGTHKELIEENGKYADIYNSQFSVQFA